jgi:hypothetical protein
MSENGLDLHETELKNCQIVRYVASMPYLFFLDILGIYVLLIVAACTLVFYDYVLTIWQEIKLIWLVPYSFAKLAFLFYRHGTPFFLTLMVYCEATSNITSGLMFNFVSHRWIREWTE